MKIRVVSYNAYEEWHEEKMAEGKGKGLSELTDKDFMEIYKKNGTDWEFDSFRAFADEFNSDGPFAPTPYAHIIRFFPNE